MGKKKKKDCGDRKLGHQTWPLSSTLEGARYEAYCLFSWGDIKKYLLTPARCPWQTKEIIHPHLVRWSTGFTGVTHKSMSDSRASASKKNPPYHGQWLMKAVSWSSPCNLQTVYQRESPSPAVISCFHNLEKGLVSLMSFRRFLSFVSCINSLSLMHLPPGRSISLERK